MENYKLEVLLVFLSTFLVMLGSPCMSETVINDLSLNVVSDGVHDVWIPPLIHQSRYVSSSSSSSSSLSSDSCEETYGFLPCTNTILGNMFLILVYGYLMFLSAKLLSYASEILLQIIGPGIIGGFFLPILSAVPDSTIILASGLSGNKETAQSQVSVGMGLLAGSNVMLLTILWGTCLIVGKSDLQNSIAVDQKDTKRFSFTGSGVSTDKWTSYAAVTMIISVIPFAIVQLPEVFHITSASRLAILISLSVCITLFIAYSFYQIFQPWIQKRKLAYVKHKHVMSSLLKYLKRNMSGRFLTDDGAPNKAVLQKLFRTVDHDSDGNLSLTDLRALIIGLQFEEMDMDIDDATSQVMKEFDKSHNFEINEDEFVEGISRWLMKAKRAAIMDREKGPQSMKLLNDFDMKTKEEQYLLEDQNDEETEGVENATWHVSKAVLILLLGTIVAAAFADPLVDAVNNFSTASNIPSFFVSFVILPFACSSEIVSTLIFVSRKKLRSSSLAFSEIYGSVTMGNILSLAVFLGLVYLRNLTWSFSSEVLIVLLVCIVMGTIASLRNTYPLWMCLLAYVLYPLSLLLVYILKNVSGWS